MGFLIILSLFILIAIYFLISFNEKEALFTNFRLAFVKASLIITLFVVLITEFLSSFNSLTAQSVQLLWFLLLYISVVFLFHRAFKTKLSINEFHLERLLYIKKSIAFQLSALSVCTILIGLFLVDLTITNNYDSYTYHLPKVEHWIQNKNVDFFPTNNVRQLYLAPFSEYFILNLKLLSGGIIFNNFVQYFAMLNCLVLASLTAKSFELNFKQQFMASVIALTIPMGLLQSTTTQTDYLESFFLIAFVFFGLSLVKSEKIKSGDVFFLCISFAIGILTKSTFYIFGFPFALLFGLSLMKLLRWKSIYILISVVFTFLLLNIPFLSRNYQQFGSPLGPKKSTPYYLSNLNESFGIKETLSNGIKNIGLHLALPSNAYNLFVTSLITLFHNYIGYPLNAKATTWFTIPYAISFNLHHDLVGNYLHLMLFFAALIIMIFKIKSINKIVLKYAVSLLSGSVLFALLLKWQPWQTRLDLPLFVLIAPFVAYAFALLKNKYISGIVYVLLLSMAIAIVFICDPVKPVFGAHSIFKTDNRVYIFNYDEAKQIEEKLNKYKVSNVGLVLCGDSWEWEYWLLSQNKCFEYVYFHKDFINTPNFKPGFRYKAIIIDDAYLKEPVSDPLIYNFFGNSGKISEITNINEKITLVIYKNEQELNVFCN